MLQEFLFISAFCSQQCHVQRWPTSFARNVGITNCMQGLRKQHSSCRNGKYLVIPEKLYLVLYTYIYRLCSQVVRVPSYTTEIYCASCEVRN
jgi:hypothetical protein